MTRLGLGTVAVAALVLAGSATAVRALTFGPRDVSSVFTVRKTENRNRVEYGVHLDGRCRPRGDAPVVPYWRMVERGPSAFESLKRIEHRAYGVASQEVRRMAEGGSITLRLRPLRERAILVTTTPGADGQACAAVATMIIAGREARLRDVLVVQAGPLSVDRIEIVGESVEGGATVRESLAR